MCVLNGVLNLNLLQIMIVQLQMIPIIYLITIYYYKICWIYHLSFLNVISTYMTYYLLYVAKFIVMINGHSIFKNNYCEYDHLDKRKFRF